MVGGRFAPEELGPDTTTSSVDGYEVHLERDAATSMVRPARHPRRRRRHRPGALPRRLRPPGGDPGRRPRLPARASRGRGPRSGGRASTRSSRSPGATGCYSTSSTAGGCTPPTSRSASTRPHRQRRRAARETREARVMTTDTTRTDPMIELDLDITGMTCASCANRIERKLNKLDGVSATVNYATERATVTAPAAVDHETLIGTVAAAGYGASLRRPAGADDTGSDDEQVADPELTALRDRLIGAVVLTVPVVAVAMVPALQFEYWQWASLTLAAPVATWGAWPFHRAAWTNLRHGCDDDGHPGVARRAGRLRLVARRAVLGRRRRPGDDAPVRPDPRPGRRAGVGPGRHLPRDGRRGDHVPPRRSLLREAVEATGGRRAARPGRSRRARGRRTPAGPGGPGDAGPGGAAGRRRPVRRTARREGRDGRRGGGRSLRGGRVDAHRRGGAGRGRAR